MADQWGHMIVTASLTSGVARVAPGIVAVTELIDEILGIDHVQWETTLHVGDLEFHQSKDKGPFPNHQFRISTRPASGFAACHYMDHDDPTMPSAISWNVANRPPGVDLIFNGTTGSVFPRAAAIPIADARNALLEWAQSRQRPTCIQWRRYDMY